MRLKWMVPAADPEHMMRIKRKTRCRHTEKTVFTIAGMVRELCADCGEINLVAIEWESEFEYVGAQ